MKQTSQAFSWWELSAPFLLKSISCLSSSGGRVCTCARVRARLRSEETHAHTYRETDGNSRTNRRVGDSSVQGLCPQGCQRDGCRRIQRREAWVALADKCPLLVSSSREQVIDQSEDVTGASNRNCSQGVREEKNTWRSVKHTECLPADTFGEILCFTNWVALHKRSRLLTRNSFKMRNKWSNFLKQLGNILYLKENCRFLFSPICGDGLQPRLLLKAGAEDLTSLLVCIINIYVQSIYCMYLTMKIKYLYPDKSRLCLHEITHDIRSWSYLQRFGT